LNGVRPIGRDRSYRAAVMEISAVAIQTVLRHEVPLWAVRIAQIVFHSQDCGR
jgi:hypothetical protein